LIIDAASFACRFHIVSFRYFLDIFAIGCH
jgi:hypothetical protein